MAARLMVAALAVALAFSCGEREHQARVAAMQHDLAEMRKAIRDYRSDKGHPPASLEELTRERYLRSIPKDPLTDKPDWRVTIEKPVRADDFQSGTAAQSAGGVVDVHSSAPGTDSNGRAWSEY